MDDRYSMRAPLRPLGRGANPVAPADPADDPLVELARIVSGRPASSGTEATPRRRGASLSDEPGMSEADLARDLEAELLSDLQASLAAVGEAHEYDPVDEEPSFTDEAYVTEQYRDDPVPDDEPYGFDPEPPVAEETPSSAGSLFVADQEPDDLQPYHPQQRQAFAPPPIPPMPVAAQAGADFDHLGLRRGKRVGGPAYNPRALAPDPTVAPPHPQQGRDVVRPVAHEPFEAVARQTFDGPVSDNDLRAVEDFDGRHRVEPPAFAAETEEDFRYAPIVGPEPVRRRNRGRLGTILMGLVAVGVAVAAFLYFREGTTTGAPTLILADTRPVRQVPENPTAPEPPNAIFARIDPTEGGAPVVLGDGAERPVDPVANAAVPTDGITNLIGGPAAGTETADDRRRVRTVVMAPDGTIVTNRAGDPGIAPAPLTTTPPAGGTTPAVTEPAVLTPPAATTDANTGLTPLATTDVTPTPVAGAPVAAAPATGTPAATPAAGTGIAPGWYVQVSSQTSEAAARADIAAFRARAPSLLGTRNAVIPTASVNGVMRYRVQFGPATQAEAQSLCNSLRAAGIDCITANNP